MGGFIVSGVLWLVIAFALLLAGKTDQATPYAIASTQSFLMLALLGEIRKQKK